MSINRQIEGRIVWLDWMKSAGNILYHLGTFFSSGHVYLYVFSYTFIHIYRGKVTDTNIWSVVTQMLFLHVGNEVEDTRH